MPDARKRSVESLLQISKRSICRNLQKIKDVECLECLPTHIKCDIIRMVSRTTGFRDDQLLCRLLNSDVFELNLSNSIITDELLISIAAKCSRIVNLQLTRGDYEFTTKGLAAISKLSHLRVLSVAETPELNNEILRKIAHGCVALRALDVSKCKHLSDECILGIGGLSLVELNVSKTLIGDYFLEEMAKTRLNKTLVDLNIRNCRNITEFGIKFLNGSRLKNLDLTGCTADVNSIQTIFAAKNLSCISWSADFFD